MDIKDYIRILINGHRCSGIHLRNYLKRESKKAEIQGISLSEFFYNIEGLVKIFYEDINKQVAKENYNYSIIKQNRIDKGLSIEGLEPRSKEMFSCHLPRVTFNEYTGNLSYNQLEFIETAINFAKPLDFRGDKRYKIYDLKNQEQAIIPYNEIKSGIDKKGYFAITDSGKHFKVFSPELVILFTTKTLLVRDINLDSDIEINPSGYYETYKDGFIEGEKYFEDKNEPLRSVIYTENAGQYIQDLQNSYFRKLIDNKYQGWKFVKNSFHNHLTHKEIETWGYYSGIVSKFFEFVNEYPTPFKDFENRDKTASKKEVTISETDQYIIDLKKIQKSYVFFNHELFEMNYLDYVGCFNLSNQTPKHPEFKRGQQIKFIYFLSQIKDIENMHTKALECFGIKNYKQQKSKAKPDMVFINRVTNILK